MDNDRPTYPLTASNIAKLQKICISSSTDDDDSDKSKSYYSDSEHESLSSANFPVQYKLPKRKQPMVNPSVNRPPMDRMAATNISVRMKHGTTARDIIVPLNRKMATPSSSGTTRRNTTTQSNSSATRRNTTTPLNKGKAQCDTTTQLHNSKPTQNALPVSSFYVSAQWMFPSASSSRTVSSSSKSNTPMLPPRSRAPAPPYTAPPPYVEPSNKPQTSKYPKRSQCPIPPYRYPSSSPPYTSQSSSMTYTSRSSSVTNTSQSFTMRNMSQMLTSSVRSQSSAPSYRPKYPIPSNRPKYPIQTNSAPSSVSFYRSQSSSQTIVQTDSTPSSVSFYRSRSSSQTIVSQTFKTPNTSLISKTPNSPKTSMHSKRSQSSTPSYRPRCPTPTSGPPYTSQSSSLTNTSPTTSTNSLKSQSSTPSHTLRNPMLTYSIPTSVPLQTSQSSEQTNTSQTSPYFLRSKSSTPSRSLRNSTLTGSSQSFAPIDTSKPSSSSKSHKSQSSASIDKLMKSSSFRLTPKSTRFNATPSFSHYIFPRAAHYNTPVSNTYYRLVPQSSTENSYPLSVFDPTRDVWPTEVGSEVRVSMQNVWYVLVNQRQTSRNETIFRSSSTKSQNYPLVDFLPLFLKGIEKTDALENYIKNELQKAWEYFNNLKVEYIQPNGIIKVICPKIDYEEVLKLPLSEKFMLVNMARQYRANNTLFETTYDYSKIPEKTIVDESNGEQIMRWLHAKQLDKYYWFFKTLNYFEIQNLTPTNIQNFVIRSNCNRTMSLSDQMEICCKIKAIRERPISLIAILIFLRGDHETKQEVVQTYLIPFIEDMLQFPTSGEDNVFIEDLLNQYIDEIWQLLATYILSLGLPIDEIEMLKKYKPTKQDYKK